MDDIQFDKGLQTLLDMGFSEGRALEALSCNNDIESAIQCLFSNSESISDPNDILYEPNKAQAYSYIPPPIQPKIIGPPMAKIDSYSNIKPQINAPNTNSELVPNKFPAHQATKLASIPSPIEINTNKNYPPPQSSTPPFPQAIPPSSNIPRLISDIPKPQPFPSQFKPIPIPNLFQTISPSTNPITPSATNNLSQISNPILINPFKPQMPPPPNLPQYQHFNSPNYPGNNYLGPKSQIPSEQNEDFIEFLKNTLVARGMPMELIQEIVSGCSSKEEALLILGIPISFKDKPLYEIPVNFLDNENIDENSQENIMKELVKEGVSVEEAYSLSLSCDSLTQALQLYYDRIDIISLKKNNAPSPAYFKSPVKPPQLSKKLSIIPYPAFPPDPLIPPSPLLKNVPLGGASSLYNPILVMKSYDSDEDSYYLNPPGNRLPAMVLSSPSESDPVAPDLKTEYFESLKDYRLIMTENPQAFRQFAHGNVVSSSPQALNRINNEIKTLQSSVPCDSTASIFVMIDTECMHRVKFLLSGTIDTPYAHGLYLFDVLLPINYPYAPPKVSILTTGNGKMRFNPNLYSNGYVCLSIINTWSGRPEEQWNPSSSSLLQVMLSIQSLVMDNDILQKEPSFGNLPTNSLENIAYQQEVMYGNMKYAMVEMIKNPPVGMEEIVRNHFRVKKNEILTTTKSWFDKIKDTKRIHSGSQNPGINAEINRSTPAAAFAEAYNELQNILKGI